MKDLFLCKQQKYDPDITLKMLIRGIVRTN